jgi:hypothetical protein
MHITMPQGQEDEAGAVSTIFRGMVQGPLEKSTLNCDCPEFQWKSITALEDAYAQMQEIDAALQQRDHLPPLPPTTTTPEETLDYVFVGSISADRVTGKSKRECDPEHPDHCWGGDLEGTFTFHVKLLDQHHGQTLKEGSVSWTGVLLEVGNRVEELSASLFLPLDQLIRDYERTPEGARVEVPNDTAQAGDTVSIKISDLRNEEGQPTQDWQRILVKIEKGKILNAKARYKEYYVFEAGKSADVNVQYRAPDACKPDKETLTVFNTCVMNPKYDPHKRKELAKKEFNIVCDQWDVKITYTEDLGGTYSPGAKTKITVTRNYSVTFKARVKFVKADRRKATYRSDDSDIQFHDNYNSHTVQEVCGYRGGFTGNKSGRGPVPIHFTLNSHNHTYSFGMGSTRSDLVSYTLSGNLLGPHEQCTGIWQQEVQQQSGAVVPRGLEKGEGPPQNRTWTPGQESITGQASWEDYVVGAWPKPATPPTHSLLMPQCYRIVYHPLVYDWGKFPNMKIKKTLSWEIKRPK